MPQQTGRKPEVRDGHAAGVIKNEMLIYGGNGITKLFGDMHILNLRTWE